MNFNPSLEGKSLNSNCFSVIFNSQTFRTYKLGYSDYHEFCYACTVILFPAIPINYVPLKFPSPCCGTSVPYVQVNCVFKENMPNSGKKKTKNGSPIKLSVTLILNSYILYMHVTCIYL